MATIPKAPTTDFSSTTISATINDVVTTISVNNATNFQTPTYAVIDREDGSGNPTAAAREVVYVSSKAGNDLTVTRGVNNSTARAHNSGALIEPIFTVGMYADLYSVFTQSHDTTGNIVTTGTASIATLKTGSLGLNMLAVSSQASLSIAEIGTAVLTSQASINLLNIKTLLSVSGASINALPLHPTWVMTGNTSAASVSYGKPVAMPQSGTLEWMSVVLRSPVSSASIIFDVNKNFVSVFEAGTRPSILGGGTYVSTASINTKIFNAGDIFSVDLDAGGSFSDAILTFRSR